jgi:hypothetical protein
MRQGDLGALMNATLWRSLTRREKLPLAPNGPRAMPRWPRAGSKTCSCAVIQDWMAGIVASIRERNHGAETTRSCVAAKILMLTYLPPATCGVVCTSMTLPLNDLGSAVPAICRHTATGMITDIIL